ncbi:MAG TPA: class I SAM-dependent methyltransferase [Syntrophales bacterium]|nr:class I SAM-dependent methyltransferase [Syntrophales bacterium]
MNVPSDFKDNYFESLFQEFQTRILSRAHGSYTKSYESYKRMKNTESLFLDAVRGKPRVSVLDVGCGDGYHIFVFDTVEGIREQATFQGVDISELKVEFARRISLEMGFENVQFAEGKAENLGFRDESFDIVLCSDVVEHLENPERCFSEIRRVLKPGGTAVITTPNSSSAMIRFANLIKRAGLFKKPPNPEMAQEGEHISLKGMKEWIRLAKDSGLEVSAVRRGALIFGGHAYDRHPALFALVLLADRLLDVLPFFQNWCEAVTLKLVKP